MELWLRYDGPLRANGSLAHKHELRRAFHSQLSVLWQQEPLIDLARDRRALVPTAEPGPGDVPLARDVEAYRFVPLVSRPLRLVAQLDLLLLRPGAPGGITQHGGDIDNRLKTLFDALRMPRHGELPPGALPAPDEVPFFCLLEDDALVTRIAISTDRLLENGAEGRVSLALRVAIRGTAVTFANMELIA